MLRRLIILLLIVGCVFGDTIIYKSSLFITQNKENVLYLGVSEGVVYFQDSNGKPDFIKCKLIKKILDSNGEELDFDCHKNDSGASSADTIESFPISKTGSISFGSGILYGGSYGISYNHFIDNNVSLLVGYGVAEYYYPQWYLYSMNSYKERELKLFKSVFLGCRYFFNNYSDRRRPIISLT